MVSSDEKEDGGGGRGPTTALFPQWQRRSEAANVPMRGGGAESSGAGEDSNRVATDNVHGRGKRGKKTAPERKRKRIQAVASAPLLRRKATCAGMLDAQRTKGSAWTERAASHLARRRRKDGGEEGREKNATRLKGRRSMVYWVSVSSRCPSEAPSKVEDSTGRELVEGLLRKEGERSAYEATERQESD
jgi:hypothetical protein